MSMHTLPPVAKSFFTFCKKCDADRYHMVLTHTSSTSAKIKCEVCGSQKVYSLPKTGSQSATAKRLTGAAAAKRTQSENSRKNSHQNEYQMLMNNEVNIIKYNMKEKFAQGVKIDHPKFGLGFVKDAQTDRIEVIFNDEIRTLMHNRQ